MVFRFTCFESLSLPTEIQNNDEKIKSTYHSAQADFPETNKRPEGLRVFTYLELINVTRNFDHISKIGEGEFGTVYEGPFHFLNRGILQVFIKRLKGTYIEGHKQWVKEVNVLGLIDHPNLVKLVGYCVEGNRKSGMQRFLMYEHMAGISLGERIFVNPHRFYDKFMLGWSSRLKVAIDVACGLACLHEVMGHQVAFGDFKHSNVHVYHRLEGDTVKLSNFGLPQKGLTYLSTQGVRNLEYVAPEYMDGGHLTSKSDVWSYGVFLFELITGKRQLDTNRPTNELNLIDWVKSYIDSERFEDITDPRINRTYPLKSVQSLCIIATMCLSRNPESRPEMRQVLEMVNQLTSEQEIPSATPSLQSLVPIDVQSETASPAQSLQSLVPTDFQHTKSSCLPRICHTKFLNSCFGKRHCCA